MKLQTQFKVVCTTLLNWTLVFSLDLFWEKQHLSI